MTSTIRYHRQCLIEGWDQSRLTAATAAVVGDSTIAGLVSAGLAVLGTGTIEVYTDNIIEKRNAEEFLYFKSETGKSKAAELAARLNEINNGITTRGAEYDITTGSCVKLIGQPSVIVETTNNPESKQTCIRYAQQNHIPLISASASRYSAKIMAYHKAKMTDEYLFEEFEHQPQGPGPSCFAASLVLREITGIIMPRRGEEDLGEIINYDLRYPQRFIHYTLEKTNLENLVEYNTRIAQRFACISDTEPEINKEVLKNFLLTYATPNSNGENFLLNRKAMIIGAGGLGNYCSWILANRVKEIAIVDYDTIEETNLNRQLFFCFGDVIGKQKADVLAKVLHQIAPEVKFTVINEKAGLDFGKCIEEYKPDLLVACVDSFRSQALINHFARQYKIPAIFGAVTTDRRGRVATYVPGTNACLDCQLRVDNSALQNYRPAGCIHAPTPSVVTNNMLVSGLAMGEFTPMIINNQPIPGVIQYVSEDSSRLNLIPAMQRCDCHKSGEDAWLTKMSKLYQES
jgi:molybdopterin/thiamine biosynthesis adenylyltransferase